MPRKRLGIAILLGAGALCAAAPAWTQGRRQPPYSYQPPPYTYTPPHYTYSPPAYIYKAPGYIREPFRTNTPDYNRAYRYPPSAYGSPHDPKRKGRRKGRDVGGFWESLAP
jgi:hypothetical protein